MGTTVKANATAALLQLLYLVTLVAGGMALIALTPSRGLGAIGYAGGALLAFARSPSWLGRGRIAMFVMAAAHLAKKIPRREDSGGPHAPPPMAGL